MLINVEMTVRRVEVVDLDVTVEVPDGMDLDDVGALIDYLSTAEGKEQWSSKVDAGTYVEEDLNIDDLRGVEIAGQES